MPENGIDFDELPRAIEARGQGLHVGERHQLILAHRDQRRRRMHPRRIHLVQVDRFAQHEEGFGAIFLHVVIAAREQIILDRKSKAIRIARGRAAEAQLKFHVAAIGRHRQRARELESRRRRRRARSPRARSAAARCARRSTAPGTCRRRSRSRCAAPARHSAPQNTAPPFRRRRRRRWHAAASSRDAGRRRTAHRPGRRSSRAETCPPLCGVELSPRPPR